MTSSRQLQGSLPFLGSRRAPSGGDFFFRSKIFSSTFHRRSELFFSRKAFEWGYICPFQLQARKGVSSPFHDRQHYEVHIYVFQEVYIYIYFMKYIYRQLYIFTEVYIYMYISAAGMKHLRDNQLVHRDLKPGNIMKVIQCGCFMKYDKQEIIIS